MIDDGLIIMMVGMLVVFAFLAIMVVTMRFMSGLILKVFPESQDATPAPKVANGGEAEIAVVIAVAYSQN